MNWFLSKVIGLMEQAISETNIFSFFYCFTSKNINEKKNNINIILYIIIIFIICHFLIKTAHY